jgi:hypothetical protein
VIRESALNRARRGDRVINPEPVALAENGRWYNTVTVAHRDLMRIAKDAAYEHARKKQLPYWMVEDLTQEGMAWLLEHPQRVRNATGPTGRVNGKNLRAEIRRHIIATGADRAPGETVGVTRTDPPYSPGKVGILLPGVYDPDYNPWEGRELPDKWRSMVRKVDQAVTAYGRTSATITWVYRHEALGDSYRAIAAEVGVDEKTVRNHVHEALEWLADWCNGLDPNRDKTGEHPSKWDEWDRNRPGMATADPDET